MTQALRSLAGQIALWGMAAASLTYAVYVYVGSWSNPAETRRPTATEILTYSAAGFFSLAYGITAIVALYTKSRTPTTPSRSWKAVASHPKNP